MRLYKFVCNICGKEIVAYSRQQARRLALVHMRDKHSVDRADIDKHIVEVEA